MFLELRKLVSGYTKLAVKYDQKYRVALEKIENGDWTEVGIENTGSGVHGLQILTTSTGGPVSFTGIFASGFENQAMVGEAYGKGDNGGLRERLKKRFRLLDWALFDYKRLCELVETQEGWTLKLRNLMQFALLPGILGDVKELKNLTTEDNRRLGFSRLAETRLAILGKLELVDQRLNVADFADATILNIPPEQQSQLITARRDAASHIPRGSPALSQPRLVPMKINHGQWQGRTVLVEYKTYHIPPGDSNPSGIYFQITHDRIKDISRLLSVGHGYVSSDPNVAVQKPSNTCGDHSASLQCVGYFHEEPKQRFGMVFLMPEECHPVPTSLHAVIRTCTRDNRSSLGERFAIAAATGRALLEWFLVDWVHKSISSLDLVFFRRDYTSAWDFSRP